jgi:hypothetical protein
MMSLDIQEKNKLQVKKMTKMVKKHDLQKQKPALIANTCVFTRKKLRAVTVH